MATEKNIVSKNLVMPEAGQLELTKYGTDKKLDYTQTYSTAKGIIQSVTKTTTTTVNPLLNGNSKYPAAEYIETSETVFTIVMSTYDPDFEAFLTGNAITPNSTNDIMRFQMKGTVPSTAPFELSTESNRKAINPETMFAEDSFGNKLTYVASPTSLTDLQYSYDTTAGKFTFSAGTADTEIYISYDYKGANITELAYSETPKSTTFRMILISMTMDYDESQMQNANTIVDRCTASGGITPPTSSNNPTGGWTVTIKTTAPRAGKSPLTMKWEPILD